jgi:hypothetical protein
MDRLSHNYNSDSPVDHEKEVVDDENRQPVEAFATPGVTAARGSVDHPNVEFGTYHASDRLAIAVAITDEEEHLFIPEAIQYDPDAKPPIYKNRRVRFYSLIGCILLVSSVVGTVIFAMLGSEGTFKPTSAPTTLRENLGIQAQITAVVGEGALADPLSPQSKALEWIMNEDPAMISPQAYNLIQRYLLALFYISTTQLKPWLSCNKAKEGEGDKCSYMKLVHPFPDEAYEVRPFHDEAYEEIDWIRWLSSENECAWAGIFCDEFNQTRAIELCKYSSV